MKKSMISPILGFVGILVFFGAVVWSFGALRADERTLREVEEIILAINSSGRTISISCSPCFGPMEQVKSFKKGDYELRLRMCRDYSLHMLGFSFGGEIFDEISIHKGDSILFSTKVNGGFDDSEKIFIRKILQRKGEIPEDL